MNLAARYAGLFHDIGKLYERSGIRKKHEILSKEFIENILAKVLREDELIKKIVDLVCKDGKHYDVVAEADRFSAAERIKATRIRPPESTPLVSPFWSIVKELKIRDEVWKYSHEILVKGITLSEYFKRDLIHMLTPKEKDKLVSKPNSRAYGILIENFEADFKPLIELDLDPEWGLAETMETLMRKYTFFIPSAVYYTEVPDISLYAHSVMTGAIAECFADSNQSESVILMEIDISGIQRFIYTLTKSKYATSLVRGRSLIIDLLLKALARKILEHFKLTSLNIVSDKGGNLLLILPDTYDFDNQIDKLMKDLEKALLSDLGGDIYLTYAYRRIRKENVENSAREYLFRIEKGVKVKLESTIGNILCEIEDEIIEKKVNKYRSIIEKLDIDSLEYLLFEVKGRRKRCELCGRTILESELTDREIIKEIIGEDLECVCKLCTYCYILGKAFRGAKYIAQLSFSKDTNIDLVESLLMPTKNALVLRNLRIAYIISTKDLKELLTDLRKISMGAVFRALIVKINDEDFIPKSKDEIHMIREIERNKCSLAFTYDYAYNYAPTIEENGKRRIRSFDELANNFLLGILRMDGDRFGSILSDIMSSLSRYMTASLYVKLFFAGAVNLLSQISKDRDYIYAIYSGGDDLVIVGKWDIILDLARKIQRLFKKFFPYEDMTLSAGILIEEPRMPAHILFDESKRMLEEVKEEGRNGVSLLSVDTTYRLLEKKVIKDVHRIPWHYYDMILESGEILYELLKRGEISTNTLYKLMQVSNLYNRGFVGHAYYLLKSLEEKELVTAYARTRLAYFKGRLADDISKIEKSTHRKLGKSILPDPNRSIHEEWVKYAMLKYILTYAILKRRAEFMERKE